jgi:hypothetical protein
MVVRLLLLLLLLLQNRTAAGACGPLLQAVQKLQLSLQRCYAELQPQLAAVGCSWHDYLWAAQVRLFFHSLWYNKCA